MTAPRAAAGRALLRGIRYRDEDGHPSLCESILAIEAEAATLDRDRLAAALDRLVAFVEAWLTRSDGGCMFCFAPPNKHDSGCPLAAARAALAEGEAE